MKVLALFLFLLIEIYYPIRLEITGLDHVTSGRSIHKVAVQEWNRNRATQAHVRRSDELESQERKPGPRIRAEASHQRWDIYSRWLWQGRCDVVPQSDAAGLLNLLLLKIKNISRDRGGVRAAGEVQVTMLERRAGCRNCSPGHLLSKFSFFKQVSTVSSGELFINNAQRLWLHSISIKKLPTNKKLYAQFYQCEKQSYLI